MKLQQSPSSYNNPSNAGMDGGKAWGSLYLCLYIAAYVIISAMLTINTVDTATRNYDIFFIFK